MIHLSGIKFEGIDEINIDAIPVLDEEKKDVFIRDLSHGLSKIKEKSGIDGRGAYIITSTDNDYSILLQIIPDTLREG